MIYLQIAGGLALLLAGAELLVRGAVGLARRLRVSSLIVGLTVVALGTSAPELVVAVDAVVLGHPEIALGNVIGSNTANILLVIGLSALVSAIDCNVPAIGRNTSIMIATTLFFVAIAFAAPIGLWQGALLLVMLGLFLGYSARRALAHPEEVPAELKLTDGDLPHPSLLLGRNIGAVLLGILGLVLGADFLVEGSTEFARAFGISERTIGLTLVAVGTSLPELATSAVAAIRRHAGVAVGNAIGSNIYNLLGVVGVTALVAPIEVAPGFLALDLWVMLGAAFLFLPFALTKSRIERWIGAGFLLAYGIYAYVIFTGLSDVPPAALAGS